MASSQNFRTAFNGFNREDVVHYLEYINTKRTPSRRYSGSTFPINIRQ